MILNKKDFEKFRHDYDTFRKLFGLMHWKIYFERNDLKDAFAESYFGNTYTATVTFPYEWKDYQGDKLVQIRSTARHEALHLFTASLTNLVYNRFVTHDEAESAVEETQRLLENFMDEQGYI